MFPLYDDNQTVRTPFATVALIAINLAIMGWLSLMSPVERQVAMVRHGFIPERIEQLTDPKLVLRVQIEERPAAQPAIPIGQRPQPPVLVEELSAEPAQIIASILTSMFLHGGWMHVLGNMWFLWIFGNNIEDRLGPALYMTFYLVGGLLATACHWAYDPHSAIPVVGASGAVATILGAYAVTFPKSSVKTLIFFGFVTIISVPALLWLGIWFVMQLASGLMHQDLGVAVWAHVGGFVAGAALMPVLSMGSPPPGSSWHEEIEKHFTFPPADR